MRTKWMSSRPARHERCGRLGGRGRRRPAAPSRRGTRRGSACRSASVGRELRAADAPDPGPSHDRDPLGVDAAARDRGLAVRLVGGDDVVGGGVRRALEQPQRPHARGPTRRGSATRRPPGRGRAGRTRTAFPKSLNGAARAQNVSGGLHAWITSKPRPAGRAEDESERPQPAVRELPDVRERPRGLRRRRVVLDADALELLVRRVAAAPFGQTTDTWKPASRSAPASSQTRRSNGTGRFWTRMRIRRAAGPTPRALLTRRAPRSRAAPRSPLRAGPGRRAREREARRATRRAQPRRDGPHDRDLGAGERFLRGRAEHLAKVRQPALDVPAVRADEPLGIDDGVVDAKPHPLAEQRLRHLDERALAEVVGLRP